MDYAALDFWWKVSITLLNMGIGIYLFWERHNDGTSRHIDKMETDLDARLDDHASRLAKVEARVELLPSHDDLGDLHERINHVSSGMDTLTGELSGIKTTLNMIHQHLLNGGGR